MASDHSRISAFTGTVTVMFADLVIASSTEAKAICVDDEPDVFYIPFKDINFEHLTALYRTVHREGWGVAHFWAVSRETGQDFMWAYLEPEASLAAVANHGAFNPELASIEATPTGHDIATGELETPLHLPTDDELVRHLAETTDVSPLQAEALVRRHGRDRAKLEALAKSFKAES